MCIQSYFMATVVWMEVSKQIVSQADMLYLLFFLNCTNYAKYANNNFIITIQKEL